MTKMQGLTIVLVTLYGYLITHWTFFEGMVVFYLMVITCYLMVLVEAKEE